MKKSILALMLMTINSARAQDTACGIVWYPPIQLSPGITAVDEMNPSIAVQGDTVHVTWALSSQKFPYRRSVNGGQTFEPIRELAPDTMNTLGWGRLLASSTHLTGFWIEEPQRNAWMVQSTDRGSSWTNSHFVTDSIGSFLFGATVSDTILLGTPRDSDYRRIYRSMDAGITWFPTLPKIIGNDPRIAMTPGVVHRVTYWGFDSSGIWSEFVVQYRKSTDLGETWSDSVNLSTMNTAAYEPAIAADGSGDSATVLTAWKDVKYGCWTLSGCGVLGKISSNSGSTFQPELRFDDEPRGEFITASARGPVLAAAWSDEFAGVHVRVSFDAGSSWCFPFIVAPNGAIQAVDLSENAIHVAWEELINGRWRVFYRRGVLLPTSASEQPGGTLPPFVTLDQNYPNPFNPTTAIRYQLPTAGIVSLSVYDVLGREIRALVSERMDAGTHEAVWDASGVPSGVYYYRLTLADLRGTPFTQTKKMIIIH